MPVIRKNTFILIAIGILLYFLKSVAGLFELDLFCKYFLYVSLGYFICYNYMINLLNRIGYLPLFTFIVLLAIDIFYDLKLPSLILGLLSIPSILYVSILLKNNEFLQNIGSKTFVIYIWNSVFIFTLSFFLIKIDKDYYNHFVYYFIFLILIGIYGPLTLRKISRKLNLNFLYRIIP